MGVSRHVPGVLGTGDVSGAPTQRGAHSQGKSFDELRANVCEVMQMLLQNRVPALRTEFVGTQTLEAVSPYR